MNKTGYFNTTFLIGCGLLFLMTTAVLVLLLPFAFPQETASESTLQLDLSPTQGGTTITLPPGTAVAESSAQFVSAVQPDLLNVLYERLNPGVVNIQVFQEQAFGLQGAGSGFILDDQGHIVTNNHVVAEASQVTVVFYDGSETTAEIVGMDDDSDLAVIQVGQLAEGSYPLPLADSSQIEVGDWVIAIGNPFGLGSSMTVGIISALGRTIASGVTPFSIPQAIQTDAAINPGNSGGPLLNLNGEVIGVNAQIATSGVSSGNVGVGFAIPSNVVRLVTPALIETGSYRWPWLGIRGGSVNLMVMEANDLPTQQGAYIHEVIPGGPADKAGLQGSNNIVTMNGLDVPVGGDVVLMMDGRPVESFDGMLAQIAFMNPGDTVTLAILRDGEQQEVKVTLLERPSEFVTP